MQSTQACYAEQANDKVYIAELYSAAQEIARESNGTDEKALVVIEAIEDGKYLEAVMIPLIW